jgi:hypothetical protein
MPERANSFPRMIPGVVLVLLAMFAVNLESPVRADSACIEQPGLQAGGTHWVLRYDPNGRGCWTLVDVFGHETGLWGSPAVMPQAQPSTAPAPTLSSQHDSSPGTFNFMGASANVTPERSELQISHPNLRHKPQSNVANANKAHHDVRDQKSNGEGHAVKRVSPILIGRDETVQFEKFLRWRERQQQFERFFQWRERQQLTGTMKPEHAVKQGSPVLIDREESRQFEEYLRSRERQQLAGRSVPDLAPMGTSQAATALRNDTGTKSHGGRSSGDQTPRKGEHDEAGH